MSGPRTPAERPPGQTPKNFDAHQVLDRISDGVIVFDSAWRFEYINPTGELVLGRSRDQLLGAELWRAFPELEHTAFGRAYRRAMVEGTEVTVEGYYEPFRAWFEARALPAASGLLLLFRDITAQKSAETMRDDLLRREQRARAAAEEASRLKDEFLATLSHELRTPLNAIVGWTHMLQNGHLGPVEQARAVEIILRNARLQTSLIEDLLDVSRIMTGKLRLQMERVEIARVLHAAIDGARPLADAKGIELRLSIGVHVGEVSGDAHRLQQVLWNLLANAVKFTPNGGRVELRAHRAGADVVIEVRDNGQGIRPDFLPHLFERFRQADGGISRTHGGLGLGLAIVRHLVELHGGSVRAASEGEGKGATFTVVLPASAPSHDEPGAPVEESSVSEVFEARALSGACVLVIDDDPDARDLLVSMLTTRGAAVLTASSAAEALEVLRKERPDVLVCDIGMPDQDGFTFMRKLRSSGEAAGGWVPAIALTGHASEKYSREALLAGFQVHVCKPVDPPQLIETIARLWRRGIRDGARGR